MRRCRDVVKGQVVKVCLGLLMRLIRIRQQRLFLLNNEVLLLFLKFVDVWRYHDRLLFHLGTVGLGSKDAINELRLATQALQGLLRSPLMALLLGEACTLTAFYTFKEHLGGEDGTTCLLVLGLSKFAKLHLHTVLLTPLQKLRLEVDFLVGHLVEVDELRQDALLHKTHAGIVASIQINSTHKCLEGITVYVRIV